MADPRGASRPAKRRVDTRDPRRSRERALKILFQADIRGVPAGEVLDRIVDDPRAWVLLDELDPDEAAELGADLDPAAAGADPEPRAAGRRAPELDGFTRSLVRGVSDHRVQLDELIQRYARRWSVGRMPVIDRNVLRLGAYELAYESTSPAVVINEVIELAKRLSTEDSGRYVNGVLESVRKHLADQPLDAHPDAEVLEPTVPDTTEPPPFDVDHAEPSEPTVADTAEPPPFDAELAEVLDAEPVEDDVLPPPDDDGDAIDLLADPTPDEPASAEDVDDLEELEELAVDEAASEDVPTGEDLVDPGEGQQQLF
jgi:transcription antitermination protein NusB